MDLHYLLKGNYFENSLESKIQCHAACKRHTCIHWDSERLKIKGQYRQWNIIQC